MSRLSALIRILKQKFTRSVDSKLPSPSRAQRRRMFLEPLEVREVMAVAVEAFMPTASGFVVDFTEAIATEKLSLYDAQNGAFGLPDVKLTGSAGGVIQGSLVVNGDKLTFLKTGGPLAADTYTATLRSAANGITDQALGQLLDGENNGSFPSGNGIAGGDFVFTFSVAAPQALVVSLPDFARGPTQALQAPATGSGQALTTGLPIRLSEASGVTSFTMTITYNPALLTITGAELGADAPQGSQVQANTSVPGQVTLAFFAIDPLSAGGKNIINLIGTVPEDAVYGATEAITITALEVNAGVIQATADSALHVVAFPGDANGNRRYDAEDARLIARTGLGLDSGFVTNQPTSSTPSTTDHLYPYVDPVVIGDVTGVEGLSPLDASDVLRLVVGLSVPNVPAIPNAQAPTALSLSAMNVAEGLPSGTTVGTFTTTDPDLNDTHTYSLVSGTGSDDNASFTISGNSLKTAAVFNQATKATYNIRVRTTDSAGKFLEKTLTINVTHENAAPTAILLSANSVSEAAVIGATVGTLNTTDANAGDTFNYSLVAGSGDTNNASFAIVGNQLVTAATLDFETQTSYSVRVRTTDQGGLTFEQSLVINVTNVNEQPTSLALSPSSVAEGAPTGTVVGVLSSVDPDVGDTHTYSLSAGDGDIGNASFTIVGNQLQTAAVFSQGTQGTYSVRIRSTDAGGLTVDQVFTITITEVNVAPTSLALSTGTIAENAVAGTVVGSLSTVDPNVTDTHTYTLVSGDGATDNASFVIVGNSLQTSAAFDFETQQTYSIRVRSADNFGLFTEQTLTITVTNVNEAPTALALSNDTVAEDAAIGAVIGTLSANDPDAGNTHTFALVSGEGDMDNASFVIVNGQLQTAEILDFESQSSYSVRVQGMDLDGLTLEQIFVITVNNVNESPTAIALGNATVPENESAGTTVGLLSSVDPDAGDTHTYSLVEGDGDSGNASFVIVGNALQTGEIFDQATQGTYSVRVRSTDAGGLTVDQVFTITITEANVAPASLSLSVGTVAENAVAGTVVGSLSTVDSNATDTHTYTLVSGDGDTDNASFVIVNGELQTAAAFDHDTQQTFSVRVRSTDNFGLFTEQMLTITVTNVNEAPTLLALSNDMVAEDAAIGTAVGTLSAVDQDAGDTHSFTLVAGDGDADNASFVIVNGELKTAAALDFESRASYSVRVQGMDSGGLTFEQTFVVAVTNVNEAPTAIALGNATVPENEPAGTTVGPLSSVDPDAGDTHAYSLVEGDGDTDNASFTVVGNELQTAAVFDQATQGIYSVRVRSTDAGGLAVDQVFTITITEVNVAPTSLILSADTVAENVAAGTVIGSLSSVEANATDTHTYMLVSGDGDTDNEAFVIVGDSLQTAAAFNFETQLTFSVRIQSMDQGGLIFEQVFVITVTDVNEAPTAIALDHTSVSENEPAGTTVGVLSAIDPDAGDTHTYSLVAGDGDTDNDAFVVVGNELQTAAVFDLTTQSSYSVRVRGTDAEGQSFEEVFTITVTEVNVGPTSLALSANTIAEDAEPGTAVGMFSTVDPNAMDTHTYLLISGDGDNENASFVIIGNTLQTATALNFETQETFSIRVRTTDSFGLFTEQVLTITVTDVNEAPTALAVSNDTVAEDAAVGTVVGTPSAVDPDAGATHTFMLVAGEGDTDNAAFEVVGSELRTAVSLNFESQASYSVRVRGTDQFGLSVERIVIISVTDMNDAPTGLTLGNQTIAENSEIGSLVGLLAAVDADNGDELTYSLVTGDGDSGNGAFVIVGNELRTNDELDFEAQDVYSVRIRVADQHGGVTEGVFEIHVDDVAE